MASATGMWMTRTSVLTDKCLIRLCYLQTGGTERTCSGCGEMTLNERMHGRFVKKSNRGGIGKTDRKRRRKGLGDINDINNKCE